jgi:PhnB protein
MNIYLNFNGVCEEAMNFYSTATKGTIESLVRFGDTQVPSADSHKDKILHGVMLIHDTKVMFCDTGDGRQVSFGDNFSLSLDFKNENTMKEVFKALSKGGKITMPLQETFWGAIFGMCTDKYGVNWMFNHDVPKHANAD